MPREVIEVDLIKTGGRLVPPGTPVPPVEPAKPGTVDAPRADPPKDQSKDQPPTQHIPQIKQCPHCLWPAGVDVVEPTPEETLAFCKAVWQDGEYTRTVSLFNGAVEVVFRALTPVEEDEVRDAVAAGMAADPVKTFDLYTDYRLGLAVRRLKTGVVVADRPPAALDEEYPKGADRLVTIHTAFQRLFKLDPAYRAVRREFTMFYARLGTLQARALDPSFFPATAAGGPSPGSPKPATRG